MTICQKIFGVVWQVVVNVPQPTNIVTLRRFVE